MSVSRTVPSIPSRVCVCSSPCRVVPITASVLPTFRPSSALISEVLPAEPVPKTTTWNRRRSRSTRSVASSALRSARTDSSRTFAITPSASWVWTSAARMTSSGGLAGGSSGRPRTQKSRAAAAAEATATAPAMARKTSASVPECRASRSCISPIDTNNQAAAPSATADRARASSQRDIRIRRKPSGIQGSSSAPTPAISSPNLFDCGMPANSLAIPRRPRPGLFPDRPATSS